MSTPISNESVFALIMAGGSGTRFWPASRNAAPKQLLSMVGDRTMLQTTVDRLDGLVPSSQILIMTNQRLVQGVHEQLPDLPETSVLGEPCKRDTAPCIGLAALLFARRQPEAVMVVMPSDHVIITDEQFQSAIRHAVSVVRNDAKQLVTFGIRPTYAAESFGYIERGDRYGEKADIDTYRVARFQEKPNADVAREYIRSGSFYWNSGIFVWRASTLLKYLRDREPTMVKHLEAIADAADSPDFADCFSREFTQIEGRSIDYAVMEHAADVIVAEAPFTWDDVGSWRAIARLHDADANGNVISGKHIGLNTNGSIVRSSDQHLVVTIGLEDCIVVHTPDATLVARKDQEEQVRQAVKEIEQRGWSDLL